MMWTGSFVEVKDKNMQEGYKFTSKRWTFGRCPTVAAKLLFQIDKKHY